MSEKAKENKRKLTKVFNVIKVVNYMKKFQHDHIDHIKKNIQNQQDLHEGKVTSE